MAWQVAAALIATQVASTALSYSSSIQQSKRLKAAAAWDRYQKDIQKKQEIIKANKQAQMLMSEKRAAIGARGVAIGTGTSLLETQSVLDELDDARFWIEKGYEVDLLASDAELASALAAESFKRRATLIQGAVNVGTTAYTGFSSSSPSGSTRSVPVSSRFGSEFGYQR